MTKKNSTKRSLLMSTLALVLCFSMLVGSTFAWFTDSVSSGGNKIQAGTLDLDLYQWTGAATSTEITNESAPLFGENILWEPGYTKVVYLSLKNNGNLNLKYSVNVNVVNPNGGKDLYEVMEYAIIPDATYGSVVSWSNGTAVVPGMNATSANDVVMAPDAEHFFALAVHMKEEAGNEYQGGSVNFDIKVVATQMTAESDSFGATYDQDANYPVRASGSAPVAGQDPIVITVTDYNNPGTDPANNPGKVAVVTIPTAAVAAEAEKIEVTITETEDPDGFAVAADKTSKTFDVKVTGLADNNATKVKAQMYIGAGLTGVTLYHNSVAMDASDYSYDPSSGWLTFYSATFSPFTVVYDAVAVEEAPADPADYPEAIVVEVENTQIEWGNVGGMYPGNPEQQLDVIYKFTAPHSSETVGESGYADWHCDYYVMLASDSLDVLPEGYITLGGNYGTWGWVGFDNPEVDTNTWIPLLGSVTENPWTYEMVVDFVEEFICGVGKTDNVDTELNGAKFIVQLRLTNPDDSTDFHVCAEIEYEFPTVVTTGD